jgi:hypothetical protein
MTQMLDFVKEGVMARDNAIPLSETNRHPLDDEMLEMQELVHQMEEERRRSAKLPRSEDPLFKNVPVFRGPVPADLSERHDDYFYGDQHLGGLRREA